jgi:hypothetical protein
MLASVLTASMCGWANLTFFLQCPHHLSHCLSPTPRRPSSVTQTRVGAFLVLRTGLRPRLQSRSSQALPFHSRSNTRTVHRPCQPPARNPPACRRLPVVRAWPVAVRRSRDPAVEPHRQDPMPVWLCRRRRRQQTTPPQKVSLSGCITTTSVSTHTSALEIHTIRLA